MPITTSPNNTTAYCFGGVFDDEGDEDLCGNFFNDCYCLDLEKLTWRNVTVSGKKEAESKSRRRKKQENDDKGKFIIIHKMFLNVFCTIEMEEDQEEGMEVEEIKEAVEKTTIADDGVFKITLGPSQSGTNSTSLPISNAAPTFQPAKRMNCGLAVKRGCLFLYGGMFEDGDKQVTYSDLYSLDLKKLDEWKTIVADDTSNQEWLGSDSDEEDSEESGSSDEDSEEDVDMPNE